LSIVEGLRGLEVERLRRKLRRRNEGVMQRLILHELSQGLYFRKRKAGYSAYRLLHLKGKHGVLKKL
jgi:hypothetical protein